MKVGDRGFFYHSNADPPAIVGTVEVVTAAYPDPYAFDRKSRYFDSKSTPDAPRWFLVDIKLMKPFPKPLSLEYLRTIKGLGKHGTVTERFSSFRTTRSSRGMEMCVLVGPSNQTGTRFKSIMSICGLFGRFRSFLIRILEERFA